jgi:hypothetical protein
MITIPFTEFPYFTEDIVLDGSGYRFSFLWSERAQAWSMSIRDLSDVSILEGVPLALNQDVLKQYRHLAIPQGELWVVDTSESLGSIGRNDIFSGTVEIVYIPVAEL